MKIKKAIKTDFEKYYLLKKEEEEEYPEIIGENINSVSRKDYKNDFDEIFLSKNNVLLVAEEDNDLIGFLLGNILKQGNNKNGEIYVIFISKNHRKKGVGTLLIKEFFNILRKKNGKKVKLSVNVRNNNAIKFYKNLGFKTKSYEMFKEIK